MIPERKAPQLITEADLLGFFQEQVESAVARHKAPVSQDTAWYLSSLLADPNRMQEGGDSTLVELQQKAVMAPPAQAMNLWQKLGDKALIVSGLFKENLNHRSISPQYYEQMGATAYSQLAWWFRSPEAGFGKIFEELSRCFHLCAEVLTDVKEQSRPCNDTDILRLYEEFQATGSPRVAERLRSLGVIPMRRVITS